MKDESRVVDALVKHTPTKDALPFAVGHHHAHVLSYASWSDAQLLDERRRLELFLRGTRHHTRKQQRPEHEEGDAEQPGEEETAALEAFALLELFQRERQSDTATLKREPPARLLHAQLALFAHYFERCHERKILHDFDVVAIQRSYQSFLDNQ